MAKVVVFHGLNTGLGTLTVKAFRREDHASYDNASRDTQRNGMAETATEETNRKGTYYASNITDGATGDLSGIHLVQLYDSDTNWLGDWYADFSLTGTSAAPLIAASSMTDLVILSGDGAAASNCESFFDGTGYAGTNNVIPSVTNTGTLAGAATVVLTNNSLTTNKLGSFQLSKGTHILGFNDISTAEVRLNVDAALVDAGATPAAFANLDATVSSRASQTSLDTLDDYVDTEVAAIKAKTDNLPSDPADQSLIIDATNTILGRLPSALDGGRMQAVLAATPPTSSEIADAVWDEEMSGHTTTGTYGGRIVRATNSNTTVQITGSNHVSADVHAFQADVIDSTALAASAVTEIQSGLATSSGVSSVASDVTAVKAKTDNLPSSPAAVGSAMTLATDAVNSTSLASSATSEIATAILASGNVDGYTLEQTLKLCLSALAGKLSGVGTGTITIRSANDTANRIVATVDGTGNRTAITLTT